jgi:hypothetical protein
MVRGTFFQPDCKFVINQRVDVAHGIMRGKSARVISGRFDPSPFGSDWIYYLEFDAHAKEFVKESELESASKE